MNLLSLTLCLIAWWFVTFSKTAFLPIIDLCLCDWFFWKYNYQESNTLESTIIISWLIIVLWPFDRTHASNKWLLDRMKSKTIHPNNKYNTFRFHSILFSLLLRTGSLLFYFYRDKYLFIKLKQYPTSISMIILYYLIPYQRIHKCE